MGKAQFLLVAHVVAAPGADGSIDVPGGWRTVRSSPVAPAAHPPTAVAWRLLGANNRELGRSTGLFPTAAACQEAVAAVRSGLDDAVPVLSQDLASGAWSWRLDLHGVAVACASRAYSRQRECRYALTAFCAAVEVAAAAVSRPDTARGPALTHLPALPSLTALPALPDQRLDLDAEVGPLTASDQHATAAPGGPA